MIVDAPKQLRRGGEAGRGPIRHIRPPSDVNNIRQVKNPVEKNRNKMWSVEISIQKIW